MGEISQFHILNTKYFVAHTDMYFVLARTWKLPKTNSPILFYLFFFYFLMYAHSTNTMESWDFESRRTPTDGGSTRFLHSWGFINALCE